MTFNKRKKNSRQRGSWSHGWGEKKKHRGAGSRAGRGNAGSGKRGDAKKPNFVHRQFGRNGFVNPTSTAHISINVAQLDAMNLENKKGVKFEKEFIVVDLSALGYTKLLGSGNVKGAYAVTVDYASKSAIEKINKAGGKVILSEGTEDASEQDVAEEPEE